MPLCLIQRANSPAESGVLAAICVPRGSFVEVGRWEKNEFCPHGLAPIKGQHDMLLDGGGILGWGSQQGKRLSPWVLSSLSSNQVPT